MMRSKGIGGATAAEMGKYHAAQKRRVPLVMPDDMDDQPPMDQIEEAKRRRNMGTAYDRATKQSFAQGGSVSSRADGCAQRGKTRGKMV